MTERLIIDSKIVAIPIGVRDADNPDKIHNHTLHFDMSDLTFQDAKKHQAETQTTLSSIKGKYGSLFSDENETEITEDNLGLALTGINEMLRAQFDGDFGDGEYDAVKALGGGNSVVNMIDLYLQVNGFLENKLDQKFAKINQRSANRRNKYLKKHGRK